MNRMRNILYAILMFTGLGLGSEAVAVDPVSYLSSLNPGVKSALLALPAAAFGSFIAYCKYVRSSGKIHADTWAKMIEDADKVTKCLTEKDDFVIVPDEYKYWKLKRWGTNPYNIYDNWQEVYKELSIARQKNIEESVFITSLIKTIKAEKLTLTKLSNDLNNFLKECALFPKIRFDLADRKKSHRMLDLIAKETRTHELFELNAREFERLNNAVKKLYAAALWNPYKALRYYALPFESDAMQQYWKICQLNARLNALKYCLEKRMEEIHSDHPAAAGVPAA
jgi:hypothetical protein